MNLILLLNLNLRCLSLIEVQFPFSMRHVFCFSLFTHLVLPLYLLYFFALCFVFLRVALYHMSAVIDSRREEIK